MRPVTMGAPLGAAPRSAPNPPHLLAPCLAALACAACSAAAPAADAEYPDVTFQGTATEGALTALLAAKAEDDPARGATFTYPETLTALPGTPVITFTWRAGSPVPGQGGTAGEAYLLAFRTLDTDQPLFRVFTSETTFTPDAGAWGLVATGAWTRLTIESAALAGDRVTAGPYDGEFIAFCIGTWQ